MPDERRRHARVTADFPCLLVGSDGGTEPFDLIDLSESGVRMTCSKKLTPMTRIDVALRLPADRVGAAEDCPLKTVGVVVWSHQLDEDRFDTGVFFPELEDGERSLLKAFVASATGASRA